MNTIMKKYPFGKAKGDKVFHSFNYFIFLIIAFIMLFPFIIVVKDSFTVYNVVDKILVPKFSLDAYAYVFSQQKLYNSFLLTVGVVIATVICHLLVTMLTAYPLSRKNFVGKKFFLVFILITFLFNGGLLPFYLLMRDLQLRNSILVYIVPSMTSAYNILIAKNFLQTQSDVLEEAAKIDGAGHFRIFFAIYLPLSKPIIAVLALWVMVGKWNDWFTGELYIEQENKLLIQNILRQMLVDDSSVNDPSGMGKNELLALAENIKMATIVVATIPILCIYPFVQKYFVAGVFLGSVKE